MRKKHFLFLFVLFLSGFLGLFAQEKPVIALRPFQAEGLVADEQETIEYLIQSYLSQLNLFRLIKENDPILGLNENSLQPNFILSGSIGTIDKNWVLTLEVQTLASGEKKSLSSIYKSMSELALDSHALVRQLFSPEEEKEIVNIPETMAKIEPANLIGLWTGDTGIEYIRVLSGNRAVAIFSSGVQMDLSYAILNNQVEFIQTSPNTLRFYHPAPYAIAVQLVEQAEPARWVFKLSHDGKQLLGNKYSTAVRYERDTILELIKNHERSAEWTKSSAR